MSKPINENPNPAPRYPAPAIQIHPQNSRDATIARLNAEVERLRACMTTAGLQCFLPNGSPEQVAEHKDAIALVCKKKEGAQRSLFGSDN